MSRLARLGACAFSLFRSASWLLLAAATPASAFFIFEAPPVMVVEYFNTITGHYFLTTDAQEFADIEAGKSGPGWVQTGLAFQADRAEGRPVLRFYGPGPNSHVFTSNAVEAEILKRPGSGWIFEREEFRIPVPSIDGRCEPGFLPVLRFYNDRGPLNDANHRYVASEGERMRMRAKGWIEEGVAFCALGAAEWPLRSFAMSGGANIRVLPSAQCEDESINLGPCVAVNNLVPPSFLLPPTQVQFVPKDYFERTGMDSSYNYVQPQNASSAPLSASGAFVQGSYALLGIHVQTGGRGPSIYSSINPLYQFKTTRQADGADRRFRPFGAWEGEVQLSISGTLNVKRVSVANSSSHAYGHPTLEFTDTRSGRNLYFTIGTYGTVPMGGEYLAPDPGTGKVIVGTSLRPSTPYGRSLGIPSLPTPPGFVSENSWGWGGAFEFRIDRAEFQRVVNAARSVDPALSDDLRDYIMDNFHFNNEVVGDGEIGLNLADYKLQLLRR